jgi:hypothetical protein
MKNIFFIILLFFIAPQAHSQGCVAIRSTGGMCTMDHHTDTSKWQLSINNRYFKSYKHFIGTVEQTQRQTLGTEVINHQYTMDITIQHKLNSRFSYMIDMPVEANSRSSLYEHNNVGRYLTHTFGIGDVRFAFYSWLWNPDKMPRGNIQVGLGIKLPTGNYNCQDFFHVTKDSVRLGPVDQSIQLGDGGTGITFELNTFYNISHQFSFYGNFYYLSNPQDVNGTSATRGTTPSSSAIQNGSYVMSVPDQMMARAGVNMMVHQFTFSAGLRDERLPTYDLIGSSDGFRRPGNIFSVEPGITYSTGKINFYAYVPVALIRDRMQSVPDIITTQLTGKFTNGDAAFADYAVNIGMNIRF